MKYTTAILFLLLSLFIACDNGIETIENKDDDGNLIEVYTRTKTTFAKQGTYLKYDVSGTITEEAQYINDTLNGKRVLYYENGKPHIVENYKMGEFSGLYQAYYESGSLEISGEYAKSAMNGEWIRNYENGQQMETVLFENNQENGPFTEWHKNGHLKAKGQYLDGDKEHGELLLYDESGELERKMNCDRGVCRTSWQRDSTTAQEII
ncbi:MAG: toxin-antitoxin system YwqK family antitoxin [Saprospiraceae bacterium]